MRKRGLDLLDICEMRRRDVVTVIQRAGVAMNVEAMLGFEKHPAAREDDSLSV